MDCNHEFIGMSTGVVCKRCQMRMTAEEFRAYLAAQAKSAAEVTEEAKPKAKKRKVKEVVADE